MGSNRKQSRAAGADEHDEGALHEAERRMLLHEGADADAQGAKKDTTKRQKATSSGPDDEHDPAALEEASEKMLLRHKRD